MKPYIRHFQIAFSLLAFFSIFFISSLAGQLTVLGVFTVLALVSKARSSVFRFFTKMLSLTIITLVVHLFFRFGEENYWIAFTTWPLWDKALYFTVRNTTILLMMSYLIKSGKPLSFSSTITFLEKHGPSRYIQPLALAMRYTSLIRDEFQSLQQVHRIMGIHRPKHFIAQVRYYTSLIIPTVISSLERAEHLSIAMTSRGYNQEL